MAIINDKLGGDESLLEVLYHFLEQDPPLNPLLASFFSKTIGNLIARKTEQVRCQNHDLGQSFAFLKKNGQLIYTLDNTMYLGFPTRDDETFLFQVISFLKKKEGFICLVLKHIDASAMMDLLLRLISCVEPASLRQEVLLVSNT